MSVRYKRLDIFSEEQAYGMSEQQVKELIRFVKQKILESYRNAIMSSKMVKANKETERKTRKFSRGE